MDEVSFIRDVPCGGYHPVRGLVLVVVGVAVVSLSLLALPSPGEAPATNQPIFLIFGMPLVLIGALMMTVSRFVRVTERGNRRFYELGNRYFGLTSRVYAGEFTAVEVASRAQGTGAANFPFKAHAWIVRLTSEGGSCDAAGFVSETRARAFADELEKE